MYLAILLIHILVCVFLIIVVLLQSGKAADLAGAFGGMGSQTAFGPRGSATLLSKATTVSAVVFMLTSLSLSILATRNAGIARDVAAAGMEIGAHSQSHKLLQHASHAVIRSEISKGIASVQRVIGRRPAFYRPAGGSVNAYVFLEAKRENVRVVIWTVDPRDWSRPGTRAIARRVLDNIRPGSVVLMHDGGGNRSQTIAALKLVLHGLKARGYEMVTLSQLYSPPPAKP